MCSCRNFITAIFNSATLSRYSLEALNAWLDEADLSAGTVGLSMEADAFIASLANVFPKIDGAELTCIVDAVVKFDGIAG